MNLLVTAGNTQTPIDQVRAITNIFTGRTGAGIALEAYGRGHSVILLTSHADTVAERASGSPPEDGPRWRCVVYRTFDDLHEAMACRIPGSHLDAVIHCAAVSDHRVAGIFAPAAGTGFHVDDLTWHGEPPALADRAAGKVKSDEPELWLRLVRTPKLVERIRRDWAFTGVLVQFKLEVGVTDAELLAVAEQSRQRSDADWMVANTLDGAADCAYLGSQAGYERVGRPQLAARLLDVVERQLWEKSHG
jgi:phosphopantothenoylcysteine synthetase/decarboxylase